MRIDGFTSTNEIATEQNAQPVNPKLGPSAGLPDSDDRSTLSSDSVSISSLAAKALASPAVRQDRVESLRQAVQSGNYEIDPAKIAASIIDENA